MVDGQYGGRKIYTNFNIKNDNPVAQQIGHAQFSALCHAVNVLLCQDTAQVHNIPMKVKLAFKAADGQYEASNDVKAYKNINDTSVGGAVVAVSSGPAAIPPSRPLPPPVMAASAHSPVPMQQAPAQQAPAQQAPAGWQPPAAAQPWAAQAQAAAQAAPAQAPAAQAPAPESAQPAWAAVPASVPQPAQTAVAQPQADTSQAGTVVPPWMTAAPM